MTRTTTWRRWVVAGLVTVLLAGAWSTPTQANTLGQVVTAVGNVVGAITGLGGLLGGGDTAIIANQMTQIAHMLTQIQRMSDVLQDTNELLTSNDIGMGNIGRLREVMDARWWLDRDGNGLSTDISREGSFNQRIPGVTDVAGWLDVLAPPETTLLATRPATEILAEEPGAFDGWTLTDPNAAAVLGELEAMGSGTASYRQVWGTLEAAAPAVLTEAQVRAVTNDVNAQARLVAAHERAEAVAAARLVHAHAEAEAASFLASQVGEASAALADLRDDDLMRVQRVEQSQLAAAVAGTELGLAQAQLGAYEAARAARERYEAERARREARARWQADVLRAQAETTAFASDFAAAGGRLTNSMRYMPTASAW